MKTVYPGIKKLWWVDCLKLSKNITYRAAAGMTVEVLTDMNPVDIDGSAICVVRSLHDKSGRREEAELTFATADYIPRIRYVAFVAECVDGRRLLIGTKEPPYPVIGIERSTGAPGGESAITTYTVTHKGRIAAVQLGS